MPDFKALVSAAFGAQEPAPDVDVIEELAAHAAATFDAARASGDDDAEAHAHVQRLISEWTREAVALRRHPKRSGAVDPPPAFGSVFTGVVADIRYATRVLRRQPGFACVAALTMALGIGATTALFSVTYGVLWRPMPWPDADRLVRVIETRRGHEPRVRGTISNGPYLSWSADHSTIETIGGWLSQTPSMLSVAGGSPEEVRTTAVTPTLFGVLKARPLLGRLFRDDDAPVRASTSAGRAIIVSYGLWQERFGGRDDVVGRDVRIDGKPATVIGVMPRTFTFPDRDTRAWTAWLPPPVGGGGVIRMTIFQSLARLRPGVTAQQASAEGTARARSAPDAGMTAVALFGDRGPANIQALPAVEQMTAEVRPALLVLLAGVVLLLITATANVASLQLARATARRREIAIRAAIGAGVGRLSRQLVVESTVVGLIGALGGLALAIALHQLSSSLLPADFPRADAIRMDWRVLLVAIATSATASLACGLLPAWHTKRTNLTESLSDDGSAPVGAAGRTTTARARTFITASQLAVSCVLLVGAALLVRSFVALVNADRGYDAANVLTARVAFPSDYAIDRRKALLDAVAERLRQVPAVRNVAYGNALPLLTSGGFRGFTFRPPIDPSIEVEANVIQRAISPEYASALGLHLLAGRLFTRSDSMTAANVIIANRTFAQKYLGPHAIGATIPNLGMCRGNQDQWQVVGIVDDLRQGNVSDPPQSELFLPIEQIACVDALSQIVFVVRTIGDPSPLAALLRNAVREQSPTLPVDSVMTMEDRVMTTLAKPRLYAVVLGGFAAFAVAIAAAGLFGVLSYIVAQRSREIGIRTALGAHASSIVRLVLQQFSVIAIGGIVVGLAIAFAVSSMLTTVLYGVTSHDLASYAAVAIAMLIVAGIACVIPASRAARVDPIKVLR